MAINPVLISVSVTGKRRKRRDLDTVIQVDLLLDDMMMIRKSRKYDENWNNMNILDTHTGKPVRRNQPWAWGKDPWDAGWNAKKRSFACSFRSSKFLTDKLCGNLLWPNCVLQVLEKFMSTVPENTNYQQQVFSAKSTKKKTLTEYPGAVDVPLLFGLRGDHQRLSWPRCVRVCKRRVRSRTGRTRCYLNVSIRCPVIFNWCPKTNQRPKMKF